MNAIGVGFRLLIEALNHPVTQSILNHALRVGTAAVVKHIQSRTRGRKGKIHYS